MSFKRGFTTQCNFSWFQNMENVWEICLIRYFNSVETGDGEGNLIQSICKKWEIYILYYNRWQYVSVWIFIHHKIQL